MQGRDAGRVRPRLRAARRRSASAGGTGEEAEEECLEVERRAADEERPLAACDDVAAGGLRARSSHHATVSDSQGRVHQSGGADMRRAWRRWAWPCRCPCRDRRSWSRAATISAADPLGQFERQRSFAARGRTGQDQGLLEGSHDAHANAACIAPEHSSKPGASRLSHREVDHESCHDEHDQRRPPADAEDEPQSPNASPL